MEETDFKKQHAIHFACESGNSDLVKYLINEKGIDVELSDGDGKSPLQYACLSGNLEVVKFLIEEN